MSECTPSAKVVLVQPWGHEPPGSDGFATGQERSVGAVANDGRVPMITDGGGAIHPNRFAIFACRPRIEIAQTDIVV
jgi:hypothetical protein